MIKSKLNYILLFSAFLIISTISSSKDLLSKEYFFNKVNNINYNKDIYSYILELNPFIKEYSYKNKLLLKKYTDISKKALIVLELPIKYNNREKNQALSYLKNLITFIQAENNVAEVAIYSNLSKDITTYKIYLYYNKI